MGQRPPESKRVLFVDPDDAFAPALKSVLGCEYTLCHVVTYEEALQFLRSDDIDAALINWDLPGPSDHSGSMALLKAAQEVDVAPPVLAFSWDTRRKGALEAIGQGASDFFTQPLDVQTLRFALARACSRMALAREVASARKLIPVNRVEGLIGNSKQMERVYDTVRKVAGVSTTVLIRGESGTGKEVVARAIHRLSPRANQPFVAFSACALPESLIEDELFGHEKGAFTGASRARRGRFEDAQGGTIFLDEIGDLPLPLQAKLLRVLQERSLERLGSNSPMPLDIRVICATNRDLESMVEEGTFRQDLYFRISVVKVVLPPLRNRADDIHILAEYFMRAFALAHRKEIREISAGYMNALSGYSWPGNVRELQNVIERSVVLAEGPRLGTDDLPDELKGQATAAEISKGTFQEAVRSFKRELVRSALRASRGNKLRAAQELQISRCYLHRLLNQLDLESDRSPLEEFFPQETEVLSYGAAIGS